MPMAPLPTDQSPKNRDVIVPRQLWRLLTHSQQQQLKKTLITVGQHLLAHLPSEPVREELNDEHHG